MEKKKVCNKMELLFIHFSATDQARGSMNAA